MAFYVYIIQSQSDGSYYKGSSEQPFVRLSQHNEGLSQYTSRKIPWALVYIEEMHTKKEALIRERALKKYSHQQIKQLTSSKKNILNNPGNSVG